MNEEKNEWTLNERSSKELRKNTVKENTLSLLTHAKANTALKLIIAAFITFAYTYKSNMILYMLFLHVLSHDTTPNICISIFVDVDFLIFLVIHTMAMISEKAGASFYYF